MTVRANSNPSHRSRLPSVDALLRSEDGARLIQLYGRPFTVDAIRACLGHLRRAATAETRVDATTILDDVEGQLTRWFRPSLRPVINLTGVVLHTNLGRAVYPAAVLREIDAVANHACNLEFDLASGKRGHRDHHVSDWICRLTGAEAATVVNNNAAAVLLVLNTLALGKEVVVSRGELIEIGGSFRMPDIMERAGVKLREVGTTNRTHVHDYANAIGDDTAAVMKVHPSNYELKGFTKSVAAGDLAALRDRHDLMLIDDMGSGCLVDLSQYGLPRERTVREAIDEGVDVVTFSGDKLLGGPQCGIIAGSQRAIAMINKNPMKRALRVDKLTLAALESILKYYAAPEKLTAALPALAALARPVDEIENVAQTLAGAAREQLAAGALDAMVHVDVRACESEIGSGALPTRTLASRALVISASSEHQDAPSAADMTAWLRALPTPIIARVRDRAVWMDCRTLFDAADVIAQLPDLMAAIAARARVA